MLGASINDQTDQMVQGAIMACLRALQDPSSTYADAARRTLFCMGLTAAVPYDPQVSSLFTSQARSAWSNDSYFRALVMAGVLEKFFILYPNPHSGSIEEHLKERSNSHVTLRFSELVYPLQADWTVMQILRSSSENLAGVMLCTPDRLRHAIWRCILEIREQGAKAAEANITLACIAIAYAAYNGGITANVFTSDQAVRVWRNPRYVDTLIQSAMDRTFNVRFPEALTDLSESEFMKWSIVQHLVTHLRRG